LFVLVNQDAHADLGFGDALRSEILAEAVQRPQGYPACGMAGTELTFNMRSFGHAQVMLGFGTGIEVIDPPELVDHFAGVVRALAEQYRGR
jgi:hypothetical protein